MVLRDCRKAHGVSDCNRGCKSTLRINSPGGCLHLANKKLLRGPGGHPNFKANTERQGRPRGAVDLQIAATAHVIGLTLVTRNLRDFAGLGLSVVDPWSAR